MPQPCLVLDGARFSCLLSISPATSDLGGLFPRKQPGGPMQRIERSGSLLRFKEG